LDGVISPDDVTLTGGTPTFSSKDVADDIVIQFTAFTLEGLQKDNYTLTQPAGITANITAATLTVVNAGVNNKVYDGATAATFTGTPALDGVISPDAVTLVNGTPTFSSKDVANDIVIQFTAFTLEGSQKDNYTLTQPTGITANITAASATVEWGTTLFTYNGSVQAPAATAAGIGADGDIPLTVTGGQINAGAGYTATASMTAANPNYTLTNTSTLFEITPAPQTITFNPVATWGVSAGSYLLTATVPSGLPVKFRVDNTALAEISGSALVPKQAGTITVTAYVDATDNNYLPAADAPRVITLTNNSTVVTDVSVTGAVRQDDGVWVVDCDLAGTTVTVTVTTDDPSATVEYLGVPGKTFAVDARVAGVHTEPYTVIAPDGSTRRDTSFRLEKRLAYGQVVIQRWNNTLLINNNPATNGGYTFTAYQWYRNGEAIAGATAQHYSAGNKATDLLGDALYHAALTTATGELLRTCPAQPEAMALENLTAYPNPLHSGDVLHLDLGMDAAQLEGAEVFVYSMAGELLFRQKPAGNPVELRLNLPMGIYIVRMNNRQVKILIEN
jgi:hypothetical protein